MLSFSHPPHLWFVSTGHSGVRQGFWTLQLHSQKQHRRSIPGVYISTGRCVFISSAFSFVIHVPDLWKMFTVLFESVNISWFIFRLYKYSLLTAFSLFMLILRMLFKMQMKPDYVLEMIWVCVWFGLRNGFAFDLNMQWCAQHWCILLKYSITICSSHLAAANFTEANLL